MLAKLLKYEFKSTARTFGVLYLVLLAFALLGRFSIAGMESNMMRDSKYLEVLFVITLFGYVLVILSTLIVTLVVVVQRFYKNLTGDEGYLMHTLPVSTHKLLQAKLITAFTWEIASVGMIILSVFILVYQPWLISDIVLGLAELGEFFAEMTADIGLVRVVGNLMLILGSMCISVFTSTLMIYAAISIGHTFKKHRILGSVLAYMGLMMLIQVISGFVGVSATLGFLDTTIIPSSAQISDMLSGIFGVVMLLELGYGCAWYFVSHYVLSSQLNLE